MDKAELYDLEQRLAETINELSLLGDFDANAKHVRDLYVAVYAVVKNLREKARK